MHKLVIEKDDANQTLFNYVKKRFKTTSLSVIYKLFRNKKIKVNKKTIKDRKYLLKENDIVEIYDNKLELASRITDNKYESNIKLQVIYEDDNILVVDKPFNLEIHSNYNVSLDYLVREYLKDKMDISNNSFVISHVHRLDKWTRGLVIYAKNKLTLDTLLSIINNKDYIEKCYYVVCEGKVMLNSSELTGFLYKNESLQKMLFKPTLSEDNIKKLNAKLCTTLFKIVDISDKITTLEAKLLTGRKHQIRASMAFLKHPIINDIKYGAKRQFKENKIGLIAYKIVFKNLKGDLSYLNEKEIKLNKKVLEEFKL